MKATTTNIRVKRSLNQRLKHIAANRRVPVSATQLVEIYLEQGLIRDEKRMGVVPE